LSQAILAGPSKAQPATVHRLYWGI